MNGTTFLREATRSIRTMPWRRYLLLMAGANLIWETIQLPLYTVWQTGTNGTMAYDVVHCTAGDILIAGTALGAAVVLIGKGRWSATNYRRVAIAAVCLGLAYTVFSEWYNTEILKSWTYGARMPRLPILGIGLSPLLQWLFLPPLCFWRARR